MSTVPLPCVEALTKDFGEGNGEVLVLKGIDLLINSGEMTALLGPSGSGKSTLLINETMDTSFLRSTHDEHIAGQCRRCVELLYGRIIRS